MFEYMLIDEKIKEKMKKYLGKKCLESNDIGYRNINWEYGVYDREKDIFITLIYYVPDGIAHCGIDFYSYIVIMSGNKTFTVVDNHTGDDTGFSIPKKYEKYADVVKMGIQEYSNVRWRR